MIMKRPGQVFAAPDRAWRLTAKEWTPLSQPTTLASGPITTTDQLMIELVGPPNNPPAILIRWPGLGTPTACQPARFPAAALAVIAIMDQAVIALKAARLVAGSLLGSARSPRRLGRGLRRCVGAITER